MDLIQINNYEMASDTIENASSMVVSLDKTRAGMDQISFSNFTNDAVIGIKAGSLAEVNGSFFRAESDGVAQFIANAAGSSFVDASNAPENTDLYICLVPSAVGKVTFSLKACAAYTYEPTFRGFYETGTQNRIFGICRKVGGVFPTAYKRLLMRPELLENLASPMLALYSDGLELNARRIAPAFTKGRVDTAYNDTTAKDWGDGTTQLFKIRADYGFILEIIITGKTHTQGVPPSGKTATCSVVIYVIDDNTGAEVGILYTIPVAVPSDQSAAQAISNVRHLPPASYAVKIVTTVGVATYNAASGSFRLHTGSIVAYPRNPNGNRKGEWGAAI